jgi:hypothetical protein
MPATETAFDPRRRLCPDGSCVGIIGADGRCSVCQRPPGAAASAASDDDDSEGEGELNATAAAEMGAGESASAADPASGFDPARRLCDDGSCVGVVGADGACSTCGQKAG